MNYYKYKKSPSFNVASSFLRGMAKCIDSQLEIILVVALAGVLMLFSCCIIVNRFKVRNRVQQVPLAMAIPKPVPIPEVVKVPVVEPVQPQIVTVRAHDNLSRIFTRMGINAQEAAKVIAINKQSRLLQSLRAGEKLTLLISPEHKLQRLTYTPNVTDTLNVFYDQGYHAQLKHVEPVMRLEYVATTVKGSVYAAAKHAGLSNKLTAQLIDMFSSKVNLRKLRENDKIALFYKTYVVNNKKVRDGDIAVAAVTHKNKVHKLIGFAEADGKTRYYSPEGYSTTSPFIRFPLQFKRISSKFSLHRVHPVFNVVRPHLGVDFVAKLGTPVKATSDAQIAFIGRKSGYGNVIILRHNQYTTAYGHLEKFAKGLALGSHVKRGQLIAYVGGTGLATGPHLHYEFRINGVHHDPLKVKLPEGELIAGRYRKKFFAMSKVLLAQLNMRSGLALAPNKNTKSEV